MTAQCRPLLVSALALLLPACLHFDATNTPPEPKTDTSAKSTTAPTPERKTQFAELISRPGTVIPLKPDASISELPPIPELTTPEKPIVPASTEPGRLAVPPSNPPDLPLLAAVRAYAEGRPDRAIEYLSPLGKTNQEFVLSVLPPLWQGASQDLAADPKAAAVLADQLRSAAARIEPVAELRLEAVKLCSEVNGYGLYDPWPKGQAYRPNDLSQLYIEVRNLISQPVGTNGEMFLIQYQAIIEIRDSYGKLVDQLNPNDLRRLIPVVSIKKERLTHTPVHDFHMVYRFQVPTTPGVYNISVKIEDLATPRNDIDKLHRTAKTDPIHRTVKTDPIQFTVAGP